MSLSGDEAKEPKPMRAKKKKMMLGNSTRRETDANLEATYPKFEQMPEESEGDDATC